MHEELTDYNGETTTKNMSSLDVREDRRVSDL